MRYLPLVWANLRRKKLRTLFTLLSILVAFVLFAYLGAIAQAFRMGIEVAGADRLVTIHKVSLIQPLPAAYLGRIAAVPGVAAVTHATWFGGVYKEPRNFFAQMPVPPESFLAMYPEYRLPAAEKQAWFADRAGAIAGRDLAERFGWKVGDRIPLRATIWRKEDGTYLWELTLRGIYDGDPGVDRTQLYFHHEYFNEARAFWKDRVGWYVTRVADPAQAEQVAAAIDALFANSAAETKTSTEAIFVQSFANQVGDVGAIIRAILSAVFLTMLLVAGNTMAQAVRERTSELAVLKTLGYGDRLVVGLVLAESTLLAAAGGGLGLALGAWLVSLGDPTGGGMPAFYLPGRHVALGIAFILGLGLATGALPAGRALRLRIVDALRRV